MVPLARALNRFRLLFQKPFHGDPVFVVGSTRTGTQLVISYLNGLGPPVRFTHEVLHWDNPEGLPLRVKGPAVFPHIRRSLAACAQPTCGAKILFHQFRRRNVTPEDLEREFPGARYILMYRRDYLAQRVSHEMAHLTGEWSARPNSKAKNLRILIPEKSLPDDYRRWVAQYRAFLTPERRARTVCVAYEDLDLRPQLTFDAQIFPFLGLERRKLAPPATVRQRTAPLEDVVQNFDAIRKHLPLTLDLDPVCEGSVS